MIYLDPSTARRTTIPLVVPSPQDSSVTMSTTASQLARAFGIVVRQMADLLAMAQDYHSPLPGLAVCLELNFNDIMHLTVCYNIT